MGWRKRGGGRGGDRGEDMGGGGEVTGGRCGRPVDGLFSVQEGLFFLAVYGCFHGISCFFMAFAVVFVALTVFSWRSLLFSLH